MVKFIDITGNKYNKLTVINKVKAKSKASAYWECLCDCGNITIVAGCKLKTGHTKSCGCHRATLFNNKIHGMANKTRTYKSWKEMRWRCNKNNKEKIKWYGDVTVCDRWNSFELFLSDMGERPLNTSIDRINPFGNYEPSNCRWATRKEQANNKRANHL